MKKLLICSVVVFTACGLVLLLSNEAFIFIFSKKVWAHKVNTVEKKKEATQKFSGIELDLVYEGDKGLFDVNHPPDTSINLSLIEYLKTDLNPSKSYWFDLKNLNDENAQSASQTLDSITTAVGLSKSRTIVESPNYKSLRFFSEKGFRVSYYLPSLYQMKKDSLSDFIKATTASLVAFPYMYISSNYRDYPLMKQFFPERNKLLWWKGNRDAFWGWRNKFRLYRMMSDEKVEVLLVPFITKNGERK